MKFVRYLPLLFVIIFVSVAIVFAVTIKKSGETIITPSPSTTPLLKENISTNFSLKNAPSESLRGTISSMSGEISWQSRVATEAAVITTPLEIQQGEDLITGENGTLKLSFPNACDINLSENTEVDIIQTLPLSIVFSQITGTAEYTKVGSSPVTIRTSYLLSEITGNVIIERDTDNQIVTVTIRPGEVIFAYNDSKFVSHVVNAKAGQTYTFNYGTRKGVLK